MDPPIFFSEPKTDYSVLQNLNPYEVVIYEMLMSSPQKRTMTLENVIMIIGAHSKMMEKGLDNLVPAGPHIGEAIEIYIRAFSQNKPRILAEMDALSAEQSGELDKFIKRETVRRTKEKAAQVIQAGINLGLIDLKKLTNAVRDTIPVQGGLEREGYNRKGGR